MWLFQGEHKKNEPYLMISTNISHGSLRRKIEEFNTQTTGLIMTMVNKGCYFQIWSLVKIKGSERITIAEFIEDFS